MKILLVFSLAFAAAADSVRSRQLQDQSLAELVTGTAELSTLLSAVTAVNLAESLGDADADPLTVLAPTDTAFAGMDQDLLKDLLTAPFLLHLEELVKLHIISGKVLSSDLVSGPVATLSGKELIVALDGGVTFQAPGSTATVVTPNLEATNGVAHTVDTVLLPKFATQDLLSLARDPSIQNVSILRGLMESAGETVDTLVAAAGGGKNTIFVPNDDALSQLSDAELDAYRASVGAFLPLLLDHTVQDSVLTTNDLKDGETFESVSKKSLPITVEGDVIKVDGHAIVQSNLLAKDGVVHIIDGIIGYKGPPPTAAPVAAPVAKAGSIVGAISDGTIPGYGQLGSLIAASRLETPDEYTLFAPTDTAIGKLDSALAARLSTAPFILHLQELLKYHINADGGVKSESLTNGMELTQANGESLTVNIDASRVFLTGASTPPTNVTEADVSASDGVLHGIDGVLVPEVLSRDLLDLGGVVEGFSMVTDLLNKYGNLVEQVRGLGTFTILVPNDAAFAALGDEKLEQINSLSQDALTQFLGGHILTTVLPSVQIADGTSQSTLVGGTLTFAVTSDGVTVNGAKVVVTDVLASDGIAHGIDTILGVDEALAGLTPPTTPASASSASEDDSSSSIRLAGVSAVSAALLLLLCF